MTKVTPSSSSITASDLAKIESVIAKALARNHSSVLDQSYLELLNQIVDTLHQLKLKVEFEHEERLKAIEDFLQTK